MPGVELNREQVQAWLDAYVDAWRTYEAGTIGALFSADATYAYHPHDEPERGREAVRRVQRHPRGAEFRRSSCPFHSPFRRGPGGCALKFIA